METTGLHSDSQLWSLVREGDRTAFESIYHRHVHALYREISKRITDKSAVEDLTQDIFLSLWEKRQVYRPSGELYPYLYGMAINRVLNYYRSNRLKPEFVEIWENLPEKVAGLSELSLAFRQAHNEETESLLDVAIRSLPERMRQVYRMRYQEQRSVPEIASLLSTSPHTVHNQLKSIRRRFVDALKNTSYFFFF